MTSLRVDAFACSQCTDVHKERGDADACCVCTDCGSKFEKNSAYGSRCGHCSYGANLREARSRVRRAEEELRRSNQQLNYLLANKKPPKGSKP